jgi:glutaminyl-peptide cyclotransferase
LSVRSLFFSRSGRLAGATLLAGILFAGCGKAPQASSTETTPEPASEASAPTVAKAPPALEKVPVLKAGPEEIWKEFSGDKAFDEVRKQVELGARPSGTPAIEKARLLIEGSLQKSGWQVERQTFTGETPRGPLTFVNLIARYLPQGMIVAPTNTQRAIVCSHYDTKRFSTITFVGASDGASSTGALLELARVLSLAPALASQVELVFFDGEEAIVQYDDKDGLYGSRHYASALRGTGRSGQFKFGILWDMIGDKDFDITLSPDSPQELTKGILDAATALKIREKFAFFDRNIYDDHVPINTIAKIPTIDLIDFNYLYWHTADDTLDRIGPEGLQHTGAVTLYHLRKTLK